MATPTAFNPTAFFANLNSILGVAEQSFGSVPSGSGYLSYIMAGLPVLAAIIVAFNPPASTLVIGPAKPAALP